jgi:hypothetical protein
MNKYYVPEDVHHIKINESIYNMNNQSQLEIN